MKRTALILLVLVPFFLFSMVVVNKMGYLGFLDLARREPWGQQLLLDLTIALGMFLIWMVPDARARRIPAWPYVLGTLTLGSIGALGYLLHRELKRD